MATRSYISSFSWQLFFGVCDLVENSSKSNGISGKAADCGCSRICFSAV